MTLLYSLSEDGGDKENQVPTFFSKPVLRTSKSIGSLSGYHPPIPPKPRSRPSSVYGGHTETDSDNTKHATVPAPITAHTKTAPTDQELVRELLFVFQGIDGKLILCNEGKFSFSKKISLPNHQRCAVLKLCEVGWLYTQVHRFTEKCSDDQSYGLVGHSFVTALREELTEYYKLLSGLEQNVREGYVSLLQLEVWTREPLARLKLLAEIVSRVGDTRGGALATCLYGYLSQGRYIYKNIGIVNL